MVQNISQKSIEFFRCEACRLVYENEETARKCEEWCTTHHSCNLDIIKHAVEISDDDL